MEPSGGHCSYKYNDGGLSSKVQDPSCTTVRSSSRINHVRERDSQTRTIYSKMVNKGSNKRNKTENSSPFFSAIHKREKEWQTASSHRFISAQPSSNSPHIQNGDSGGDFQEHHGSFMGLFGGYRRCLLPRTHALGVSQVPGIQASWENLRFPVPPVWPLPSPMGFFQGNQAHKTSPPHPSNKYFQLLGRLHYFLNFSRETEGSFQYSSDPTSELGIQNQLGKIESHSLSVDRVSRCNLESTKTRTFSSSRENNAYQGSLLRDEQERSLNKERVRKPDRSDKFCVSLCAARKTSSLAYSNVDESPYSSMLQGCSGSSGREVQGVAKLLDVSRIHESPNSDESSQTFPRPDDGCITGGMVRNSSTSESSGFMARECETPINELEGAESCSASSDGVPACVTGEIGTTALRQLDSSGLPEEPRLCKTCSSSFPNNGNSVILSELGNQPSSSSSEGCSQCSGRPRVSPSSNSHRMVIGQEDIQLVEQSSSSTPSRSLCHEGELSASSVCLPLSGPAGSGLQCFQLEVGQLDVHLSNATNELSGGRGESSSELPRQGNSGSSLLAIERVVPSTSSQMQGEYNPSSTIPLVVPDDIEGSDGSQGGKILESSRLDSLISSLASKGVNNRSIEIIKHAHKPSTMRQYQGTWKKFMSFLDAEQITHEKVDIYVVMNFLAFQHTVKGLKYRTIASYKSALVQPLYENFGFQLDDFSLEFFMKGVFNLDPPKPAPMAGWSLDSLLSFLVSDHFEPLHSKSVSIVTKKFLCLLLLATGRRIDEVGHLAQRFDYAPGGKSVTVHWLPDYTPKHFNKDFQPLLPSFEGLDSELCEDLLLCPIRALRIYLGKIQSTPRGSITRPLWNHSSKVLTNMFISTTLQAKHFSGELEEVAIGPHHMRKFAASYSAMMIKVSMATEKKVMERMGCKTMNVLKRHYINNIPNINFKTVIPAGTFVPSAHFGN